MAKAPGDIVLPCVDTPAGDCPGPSEFLTVASAEPRGEPPKRPPDPGLRKTVDSSWVGISSCGQENDFVNGYDQGSRIGCATSRGRLSPKDQAVVAQQQGTGW